LCSGPASGATASEKTDLFAGTASRFYRSETSSQLTHWAAYDIAWRQRGSLTVWLTEANRLCPEAG
jgi:hypothetical protein